MKIFGSKKASVTIWGVLGGLVVNVGLAALTAGKWISPDLSSQLAVAITSLTGLSVASYNHSQGKVDVAKQALFNLTEGLGKKCPEGRIVEEIAEAFKEGA